MHPGIEGMRIRYIPRIFAQSSPPFVKHHNPVGEKGARRKTHSTLKLFRLPEVFSIRVKAFTAGRTGGEQERWEPVKCLSLKTMSGDV
jgi:hypothetical protein